MTKRELEKLAWKLGLNVADMACDGKKVIRVYKPGQYRQRLMDCKTKRELEQFLIGVKVGKEMG